MFQPRSIQSSLSLRDKIVSIDYVLVFSIFIFGNHKYVCYVFYRWRRIKISY